MGDPSPAYLFDFDCPRLTLDPDVCRVVAEDNGGDLIGSILRITEMPDRTGQRLGRANRPGGWRHGDDDISALTFLNGGIVVNIFHGATITFLNQHRGPPPPPQVCDFITFGRLVTEVNGQKVVISGNAGGNKPGGGILGEFHIEANGVDNHVADIDTYVRPVRS